MANLFDIDAIPVDQIPALIIQLAVRMAANGTVPAPAAEIPPSADRMLTALEVAERLRCSTKSVYRRVKSFPFARRNGGRGWIFSEQGLTKWLARQRV
jgi:predicted DNA-binding transcriptional regulator AlpA